MNKLQGRSFMMGAYWGPRAETREECAARLARFLTSIVQCDSRFRTWYARRGRPVDLSPAGLFKLFSTNNRDDNGEPIPELGFSLVMSGEGAQAFLSVSLGLYTSAVSNCVRVEIGGVSLETEEVWRCALGAAIAVFEPDNAVVTCDEFLKRQAL